MKAKSMWTIIILLVSTILLCSVPNGHAEKIPGVTKDSIIIGSPTDLTGPAAWYGKQGASATEALFKHINEQGGIHGRKLKVIFEDHVFNPVKAIAATKYLISRHNVFALVNIIGSTPMRALIPLIEEKKIPTLPPLAVSTLIWSPPKRYVFNTSLSGRESAIIVVDYIMNDLKVKNPKLAMFNVDDEMGKDYLTGLREAAEKYGLKIVAEESYKRGAVDFTTQLMLLRRANPDYVFHCGYYYPLANVMEGARKFNWHTNYVACQASGIYKLIEMAGEAAQGCLNADYQAKEHENIAGMMRLKEISRKYDPKIEPEMTYIFAWCNALVLIEGLKRAGRDLTREGLIEALETLREFDPDGLCAPITYGPNYRKGCNAARVFKSDVGKKSFLPLTSWRRPSIK